MSRNNGWPLSRSRYSGGSVKASNASLSFCRVGKDDRLMTAAQLIGIRKEFEHYLGGFHLPGRQLPSPLRLKNEHSVRVAGEARILSFALAWSLSEQNAAEGLGLLHDVGRFSQFSEYGTFADSVSVDHGERGWTVVKKNRWLLPLPLDERETILDGIRYHNRRVIPEDLPARSLGLVRLIRDADKLDIFCIVLDAIERDGFRDLATMLPNITLSHSPSPQLVDEIVRRKSASLNNVRSLADFLLMQVSWMYDLNYLPTFQRVHDHGILPRILSYIDGDVRVHAFGEEVHRLVLNRIGKIGRNDPCPCGSGKKYKHCCGVATARFKLETMGGPA